MNLNRAIRQLSMLDGHGWQTLPSAQKEALAQAIGLPREDLDRLQWTGVRQPHFGRGCPHGQVAAKGHHPNAFSLLKNAATLSAHSLSDDELRRFSIEDQLRMLAKDRFYDSLSVAIEQIWDAMENWRHAQGSLLGTTHEIRLPDGRTAMSLEPLNDKQNALLQQSPSTEAAFAQLIYYTRTHWGAALMQWVQQAFQQGRFPRHVPHILIPTRQQVPFEEILWRGVNTAIKIIYSIQRLLWEMAGPFDDPDKWRQAQKGNYSFAALLAASSLSTFEPLEHHLVQAPDAATLNYLLKNRILKKLPVPGQRTGLEMLSPRWFAIDPQNLALDFSAEALEHLGQLPLLGDVLVKKCPALKVNVVRKMYDWVTDVTNLHVPAIAKMFDHRG